MIARVAALGILLVCVSCGGDAASPIRSDTADIATTLPSLTPVDVVDSVPGGYFVRDSELAIGPRGHLVVPTLHGPGRMAVRSPDGTVIALGSTGDGPGEVRSPLVYEVTDTTIVLFDRSTSRLSAWTISGELVDERPLNAPVVPTVAAWPGRGWVMADARHDGLRVVLVEHGSGERRDILTASDSFGSTHWIGAGAVTANPPAIGVWPGGLVVAQRLTYEVAFYDTSGALVGLVRPEREANRLGPDGVVALARELALLGRPLSPARRSALTDEAQPWIRPRLRSDAAGRTWALGQRGDSSFFDVFAGPKHLGRIPIACLGLGSRWDLSGTWVALICAPDDAGSAVDAQVRIFRIEG